MIGRRVGLQHTKTYSSIVITVTALGPPLSFQLINTGGTVLLVPVEPRGSSSRVPLVNDEGLSPGLNTTGKTKQRTRFQFSTFNPWLKLYIQKSVSNTGACRCEVSSFNRGQRSACRRTAQQANHRAAADVDCGGFMCYKVQN